ncbi:hypothetical protein ACFFHM_22990 [Halalkalibacter kiskunsagensis]|uniref:Uncharacterized protein n=1 Tax=Halalkalibacter kiskunsagensis TaxID=1548599 RepID=A0ABV6KIY2_9BACI
MEKPLLKIYGDDHKKQETTKQEESKVEAQQEEVVDPWQIILFGSSKK